MVGGIRGLWEVKENGLTLDLTSNRNTLFEKKKKERKNGGQEVLMV